LHVADGSEIITRQVKGPHLDVAVGAIGLERSGSCLRRLVPARLADGYLPILQTSYTDAGGVRYDQESFAGRIRGSESLVSFVRVVVDASRSRAPVVVRFTSSRHGLATRGDRLATP